MQRNWRAFRQPPNPDADRGATIVEYVLLLSCIALLLVASLTLLGADLKGFFSDLAALWP